MDLSPSVSPPRPTSSINSTDVAERSRTKHGQHKKSLKDWEVADKKGTKDRRKGIGETKQSNKERKKECKEGRPKTANKHSDSVVGDDNKMHRQPLAGKRKPETSASTRDDEMYVRKLAKAAKRGKSPDTREVDERMCPSRITVGSDCTGYGSELIALKLLGIKPRVVFVAEKDPGKRELLSAVHGLLNHGVKDQTRVYEDVKTRQNETAPYVDIFISGAPCPPFSSAGKRMGLKDLQGRGVILFFSLDFIRLQRPRLVIIENVQGLTQGSAKSLFEDVLNILRDLGYTVHWEVLNTRDQGIPQSRPRVWVVAIRTRFLVGSFTFPGRVRRPDVASFLDTDDIGEGKPCDGKLVAENIRTAQAKHGKTYEERYVFVDVAAGEKFANSAVDVCPCITKSRGRCEQPQTQQSGHHK